MAYIRTEMWTTFCALSSTNVTTGVRSEIRIVLRLQYLAAIASVIRFVKIDVVTARARPFLPRALNPLLNTSQMEWNSALFAVPNFTPFADRHHADHAFELSLHHTLTDRLGAFRLVLVWTVSWFSAATTVDTSPKWSAATLARPHFMITDQINTTLTK